MNKNLKPFDLQRALAGDTVVNEDGMLGKLVYESILVIGSKDKAIYLFVFKPNDAGKEITYWADCNGNSNRDSLPFMMTPKTKKMFCAVSETKGGYGNVEFYLTSHSFESEEDLKKEYPTLREDRFKIVSFEVEV